MTKAGVVVNKGKVQEWVSSVVGRGVLTGKWVIHMFAIGVMPIKTETSLIVGSVRCV